MIFDFNFIYIKKTSKYKKGKNKMIAKILLKFCSLFPKSKLGILLSIMFTKASSVVIKDILDPENQKKAYEFVKQLHNRTDISNKVKAKEFNKMMIRQFKKEGKEICDSVINCLRELAVNAIKTELNDKTQL